MAAPKKAKPKGHTVKQGGAISNGEGGFFKEGDTLPELPEDTVAGLQAKGFI